MKRQLWFMLLVLGLLVTTPAGRPIEEHGAPAAAAPALLQFTSGGHVLGFAPDAVYVADGSHAYRVEFVGAAHVAPVADSAQGDAGRAAPLSRVTYAGLWPGVTLTYDAPAGALLRSTYRLEPFADPAAIRLRYNVSPQVEGDGTLALAYDTGVMRESAPLAWQEIESRRVPVQVAFTIRDREVGFAVGEYDPAYPLFIDPTLTWNTFLGGTGSVVGEAVAVDGSGNVYVAGTSNVTWGTPVRAHGAGNDAFVAKLNSSGELMWHTFLGGNGVDYGHAIAIDGSGNIYVAGESTAAWQGTNPPVRAYTNSFDAFVARLDSSGNLTWNTFLGGNGWDDGLAIAVDGNEIYVAGHSTAAWQGTSPPVRAYTGGSDAFVARLNKNTGALGWNTFLGGSGSDRGTDITAGEGDVLVTGTSNASWQGTSAPLRPYSGGYDAFAATLDASTGALEWNTFLGGSGNDYGTGIALLVYGAGSIYVAGFSDASWGSPVRAYTGGRDAFLARLNSNGTFSWNTFLGGGAHDDYSGAIAVDVNNIYVVGSSGAAWGSPVRAYTGDSDAFVARVDNSNGSLTWHTFLGGNLYDGGYGIALGGGNLYVVGISKATWGSPVRAYTAGFNVFASRLNSSGVLAWHTFLGGVATDAAYAIAADWSGNVYVAGYSDAYWGLYVRGHGGAMDAFVAKLNRNGSLIWNTFLGGVENDVGHGIAVDGSGNVYVVGISYATWHGTSPPVRNYQGSVDAFVAKLDGNGNLLWNTFLGGTGFDRGFGIAWAGGDSVYVAGDSDVSWGSPVRIYQGSGDAFAARLNSTTGALVWNTFLGGSSGDEGRAISVDINSVYVAGTSCATWQGTSPPRRSYQGNCDAFAAKLNRDTGALVWNTFLGGSQEADRGCAILGTVTHVHVAGNSNATWQGTTAPVRAYTGGIDTFVASLDSNGNLIWNTFLGGSENDPAGYNIAVDEYGYVYVAGHSPTAWGTPIRGYTAGKDAFAAKLSYYSGELAWNAFLGGDGDDEGYAIAVDEIGQAIVAGRSEDAWGIPSYDHNGDWDAFVAQLGNRVFLPLVMRP